MFHGTPQKQKEENKIKNKKKKFHGTLQISVRKI